MQHGRSCPVRDMIMWRYDPELLGARQVREQGRRQDFRGVIDPLLSWRESIGRKKGPRRWRMQSQTPQYQDRAEGQRPRNFIRLVLMGFSSRWPKVRDFGLMQECWTKEQSRQYAVLYLFSSKE
ncbi:hypothetical protein B296_00035714 [Ensete ventricosum]|uniref:Uncharacterized protein n=1 Tax=Ensete ventricosum TaxID=4639 RepID=A0A426XC39_ENSVE|nr:hypothetical protein B296_00035714 [Ensete ventricosum]